MKRINIVLGLLALVVLMFFNVSFGTFEQVYPDVKVETIEANDQIGEEEGKWAVVDCGPGTPGLCIGVGNLTCCD